MKSKKQELDVDFIQSKPLSESEEKALSEYIKKLKDSKSKIHTKKAA
jgi:F0F1-type ATP synthase delta subunit